MAKLMIKSSKFDIELPLKVKYNLIGGDSGTGKTYLINILRLISDEESFRMQFNANIDLDRVETIKTKRELKAFDFNHPDKIVFIDRGDYILTREDYIKIGKSPSIYFICSRIGREAPPIDLKLESFLTLGYSIKDGVVSFRTKEFI